MTASEIESLLSNHVKEVNGSLNGKSFKDGQDGLDYLRKIKQVFDPSGIMNPSKFI